MEGTVAQGVHRVVCLLILLGSLSSLPFPIVQAGQQRASQCAPTEPLIRLPEVPEASGLAVSHRTPGRMWTHNDSGEPVVFALDSQKAVVGRVRVNGASVEDWEAIAVGPCGTGSCLYIGDIGDNQAVRKQITIYRLPEPERAGGTANVVEVFHATYPDGAHDAETLLMADGRLYIVTKGETGPVAIYRFPATLQSGMPMQLERLGEHASKADRDSRITDGSVSLDNQWVVLRSRSGMTFYRASDLLAGRWHAASTVDLTAMSEPQGEGVALGAGGTVFLAGEGGGKGQAGTLVRFSCTLPRS